MLAVSPTTKFNVVGFNVIFVKLLSITVTSNVSSCPFFVFIVIVAFPALIPVTVPLLTVAILSFDDLYVTFLVLAPSGSIVTAILAVCPSFIVILLAVTFVASGVLSFPFDTISNVSLFTQNTYSSTTTS